MRLHVVYGISYFDGTYVSLAHQSFNREPGWTHYAKRLSSAIPSEYSHLLLVCVETSSSKSDADRALVFYSIGSYRHPRIHQQVHSYSLIPPCTNVADFMNISRPHSQPLPSPPTHSPSLDADLVRRRMPVVLDNEQVELVDGNETGTFAHFLDWYGERSTGKGRG